LVEYRANPEARRVVVINDPQPVGSLDDVWSSASSAAIIGIFLLLFGAFLYFGRAILLPIFAAAIVALTLGPAVKAANRRGISPWITALLIVLLCIGALTLAAMALAGPVSAWIGRAPEIGATIKEKLSVLEQPLESVAQLEEMLFGASAPAAPPSAPSVVLPVVAFITPAAGELLVFFGTLMFFLVGQLELRAQLVSFFPTREAKLRFLKIVTDVERNLASYLAIVTVINACLGVVVALGAWALGFPNPAIFGVLAALLNYVPYVGPAVMVVILFTVGLVSFPSLGQAFIAPLAFVLLTTMEGHFITPTVVGRRVTLNPLLIFLALAFWTWMWGPIGAFLAAPLSIIGLVVVNHLVPSEDVKLPE
jgi:predicted PurR-regulated permease PerM